MRFLAWLMTLGFIVLSVLIAGDGGYFNSRIMLEIIIAGCVLSAITGVLIPNLWASPLYDFTSIAERQVVTVLFVGIVVFVGVTGILFSDGHFENSDPRAARFIGGAYGIAATNLGIALASGIALRGLIMRR